MLQGYWNFIDSLLYVSKHAKIVHYFLDFLIPFTYIHIRLKVYITFDSMVADLDINSLLFLNQPQPKGEFKLAFGGI